MVIQFSSFKDRKSYQDPRMLLQPKGKVLHLPESSERKRECGCTIPVPNALMRMQADRYRFTLVSGCPECGERAEFDTSALHALAELSRQKPTSCDCCHQPSDQVTRAEMESPDGGIEWAYLCDVCIEQMDEESLYRQKGGLPW